MTVGLTDAQQQQLLELMRICTSNLERQDRPAPGTWSAGT